MKQPMQIDIASAVVQQIKDENIPMRSRVSYALERIAKVATISLLVLIAIISVASLVYSVNNQLFREYLEFGRAGIIRLSGNVPWLSVAIIVIALASTYLLVKNLSHTYKNRLIVSFAVLLLVFGVGGIYGLNATATSRVSKLANTFRLGNVPERAVGTVIEVNSNFIIVANPSGNQKIIISKSTLFKGDRPQVGDSVLVLINKNNNQLNAQAIKIIDKIQKPAGNQIDTPKPVEPIQDQPTTEQPTALIPVQKSVTTATSTDTTIASPAPAPTPPPSDMTINIYNSGALFKWKTTYVYDGGYKLVWSKNAYPTYPGRNAQDTYFYNSNPVANPQSYTINAFDGPGLYYVRVCGLDAGHTCIQYSTQLTVTLP